jgi:hypothetical protein
MTTVNGGGVIEECPCPGFCSVRRAVIVIKSRLISESVSKRKLPVVLGSRDGEWSK